MDNSAVNSVLQFILDRSEPLPLPSRWKFLGHESTVRRLTCDPVDLQNALQTDCDREILLKMGVFVRPGIDDVVLCPPLNTPQATFAASFREKVELPHELVMANSVLPVSKEPAVFRALSDSTTRSASISLGKKVVVAFSLSDLAILRTLGIPATMATDLAAMKAEQLRLLFGRPADLHSGEPGGKQRADIARNQTRIILAGWNLSSIRNEEPEEMVSIRGLILQAYSVLGFNTDLMFVWQPASSDLNEIRAAVDLQDEDLVRRFLRESIADSVWPAASSPKVLRTPGNYAEAKREIVIDLRRAESQRGQERSLSVKLDQLNLCHDQEVIQPILDKAKNERNPVRSALLINVAELTSLCHAESRVVREARWVIEGRRRNLRPDFSDSRKLGAHLSHIQQIYRELSR